METLLEFGAVTNADNFSQYIDIARIKQTHEMFNGSFDVIKNKHSETRKLSALLGVRLPFPRTKTTARAIAFVFPHERHQQHCNRMGLPSKCTRTDQGLASAM